MTTVSKYIYGMIEEPDFKIFEMSGLEGAAVSTINFGDLAAIVSDIEISEIDPTRRNVMAHTMVQDGVSRRIAGWRHRPTAAHRMLSRARQCPWHWAGGVCGRRVLRTCAA